MRLGGWGNRRGRVGKGKAALSKKTFKFHRGGSCINVDRHQHKNHTYKSKRIVSAVGGRWDLTCLDLRRTNIPPLCKNQTCAKFFSDLVHRDKFITTELTQQKVGHTHGPQDQRLGEAVGGFGGIQVLEDPEGLLNFVISSPSSFYVNLPKPFFGCSMSNRKPC